MTSSVNLRHRPSPRQPRPVSIAITGITHDRNEPKKTDPKPPLPKARKPSLTKHDKLKKKAVASPTDGSPKTLASPVTDNPTLVANPESGSVNNNIEQKTEVIETKPAIVNNENKESTIKE